VCRFPSSVTQPRLRAFYRYSLDSSTHKASTNFSSQRPRSFSFEPSARHPSSPSSASHTPTHTSPHKSSFAPASLPGLSHFGRWSESLRNLSTGGHTGSANTQNTATDKEGVDEKSYPSTDTDNEVRRDVRTRKREGKRRRRMTEIYVGFLFLLAAGHKLNYPTDHSPYFITYLSPHIRSEASTFNDDVRRPDTSPSSPDTEHRASPRYIAVVPIPP
jgi:hypothetical protein